MNHEKNIIELKDITVRFDGETVLLLIQIEGYFAYGLTIKRFYV